MDNNEKSKKEKFTYDYNEDHVELFCNLQDQADKLNSKKNRWLVRLIVSLLVFIVVYIYFADKRFDSNIEEAKFFCNPVFLCNAIFLDYQNLEKYMHYIVLCTVYFLFIYFLFIYLLYFSIQRKNKWETLDYLDVMNLPNNNFFKRLDKKLEYFSIDLQLSNFLKNHLKEVEFEKDHAIGNG